jgi:hypothetical protein
MRTYSINVYKFDELPENIQERVIGEFKNDMDYTFYEHVLDEGYESIKLFCNHFGVDIQECHMSAFNRPYIITTAEAANFRGVKLNSINPDHNPTGFYIDSYLWETMHSEFKMSGNAFHAFECALQTAIEAVQRECEGYYEDESIIAMIEANEYEFTDNGEIYTFQECAA